MKSYQITTGEVSPFSSTLRWVCPQTEQQLADPGHHISTQVCFNSKLVGKKCYTMRNTQPIMF